MTEFTLFNNTLIKVLIIKILLYELSKSFKLSIHRKHIHSISDHMS